MIKCIAWTALACGVTLLSASYMNAAETKAAYVGVKVALARSGPGLDQYATEALTLGDYVEVLEEKDGWTAIQPPLEAYSWVDAAHLRLLNDQEAEVTGDDVKAWLGSEVEQVEKHVSQVQLRRGERVEIVGKKEVETGGAKEAWFKIRPPVGERRWVRSYELTDSPPLGAPRSQVANRTSPREKAEQWAEEGWSNRSDSSGSLGVFAQEMPGERARHNSSRSSFFSARDRLASSSFEDEVARLQLALTRAATELADSSEIAALRREIEGLVESGRTPLERGQASRLLESAEELKKLVEKREDLGLADTDRASGDGNGGKRELEHFEVKGWLMPVAWYGRPTELCAVMNDEHTPLAFVSPAPGLNLRRYLNKEVGIIGEESFNKIHEQRHIVAHRVVELSRHRDPQPDMFSKVPWIRFRPKQQPTASLADLMSEDNLQEPEVSVE